MLISANKQQPPPRTIPTGQAQAGPATPSNPEDGLGDPIETKVPEPSFLKMALRAASGAALGLGLGHLLSGHALASALLVAGATGAAGALAGVLVGGCVALATRSSACDGQELSARADKMALAGGITGLVVGCSAGLSVGLLTPALSLCLLGMYGGLFTLALGPKEQPTA